MHFCFCLVAEKIKYVRWQPQCCSPSSSASQHNSPSALLIKAGLVKNFAKPLDKRGSGFYFLCQDFADVSSEKMKSGTFGGWKCIIWSLLLIRNHLPPGVPVQSKMTANLRHYLHSPIPNIIKIRDKYRILNKTREKIPVDISLFTKTVLLI